jgi:hypothetical protein
MTCGAVRALHVVESICIPLLSISCCGMHIAFFSILLSPPDQKRLCGQQAEPNHRLFLLPKHLPVGLTIGIKAIMFTPFPSGFQFGPSNVPVRTAFP